MAEVSIANGVFALLGAIVGAAASTITHFRIEKVRADRERRALAGAFRGEIAAILSLSDRRKYVQHAITIRERMRAGENVGMPTSVGQARSLDEQFKAYPVFNNNVGKIGVLGAENAAAIATFYGYLLGITASLRGWEAGEAKDWSVDVKIAAIDEELELWADAEGVGKKLLVSLNGV